MKYNKILLLFVTLFALSGCGFINNSSSSSDSTTNEHSHNYNHKTTIVEPTCEEDGYTIYECDCGDYYKGNFVDASHNLEHIERIEATCSNPGQIEHWHCIDCDKYFYDEHCENQIMDINNLIIYETHWYGPTSLDDVIIVYPNESSPGYLYSLCEGCGNEKKIYYYFSNVPEIYGVAYSYSGDSIKIVGVGLFEGNELIIPNEIDEKKVTGIEDYGRDRHVIYDGQIAVNPYLNPFFESNITKLVVGDNVETIKVTFSDAINEIVFSDKGNLKELDIRSLSSRLSKIDIPEGVEKISLDLPMIEENLDLTFPKTLNYIERVYCDSNLNLKLKYNGTIKDFCDIKVKQISRYNNCPIDGDEIFGIQNSKLYLLDKTGKYTLCNELIIPSEVKTIPTYRFFDFCFESIIIEEGVEQIGYYAFDSTHIKSITIPNSLVYLDDNWADAVSSRTRFPNLKVFSEYNQGKYIGNDNNPYLYYVEPAEFNIEINVSDETVYVDGFFDNWLNEPVDIIINKNVKKILLPRTLITNYRYISINADNQTYTTLGQSNSIILKDGNKLIAGNSHSLIPEGVEEIGDYAFWDTNISKFLLPYTIKSIGYNSFDTGELDCIFYEGNKENFSNISVDHQYSDELLEFVYYYSETTPTEEGNYWHYDSANNPVKWE